MRRVVSWVLAAGLAFPLGCGSLIDLPSDRDDATAADVFPPKELSDLPGDRALDGPGPGKADVDVPRDPGETGAGDPGCTRQCYGRACGDDGCGGTCGSCPSGTRCSSDGSQCLLLAVQQPLGGPCGPTATCSSIYTIPWAPFSGVANPDWPGCQDDQCREGPCVAGLCSRGCTPTLDAVQNGTGIAVADGIEDDGAPAGDCEGALAALHDGPWACVEAELPGATVGGQGRCVPRSSFLPCYDGTACPEGEACGYLKVRGNIEARCLAGRSGGGVLADPCGYDEASGEARTCRGWTCSAHGCSTPCAGDAACLTAGARCDTVRGTCSLGGGACASDADCSAWACTTSVLVEDPPGLYAACAPRGCRSDAECRDPAFYCRHDPARVVASVAGDPLGRCTRRLEGGAAAGQACTVQRREGLPYVPCADEAYCLDGWCGALCAGDADCAEGQRCGLREIPTDLTGDGRVDLPLRVPLCVTVGEAATSCLSEADCGGDRACVPLLPAGTDPVRTDLLCMEVQAGAQPIGSACGEAAFGATCRSRACLGEDATNGVAGTCSAPCRTREDCPAEFASGSDTVRWTCEARVLSASGTNLQADDVWSSWCVPVPGGSSLASCDAFATCAAQDEYCHPMVRAGAPGGEDRVEYACVQASGGALPGHPCDPGKNGADCATGLCESSLLEDVGFCSLTCRIETDCALLAGWGATCAPRVLVPRTDPSRSLTVPVCRQVGTCVTCRTDLDCAVGLRCVNASPVPYLQEMRCAKPCEVDGDCVTEGEGIVCTDTSAPVASSQSGRALACLPLACP